MVNNQLTADHSSSAYTHIFIILILGMFFSTLLKAETLNVTAEFRPNAANPNVDEFTNTTPLGGFCKDYPQHCGAGNFSLSTGLSVSSKSLIGGSSNLDDGVYQKLDAGVKVLTLTDSTSGKTIKVNFRLNLIGQRYYQTANALYSANFNAAGRNPNGNCTGTMGLGYESGNAPYYIFGWIHNSPDSECYKAVKNFNYNDVTIRNISLGYQMTSDRPMDMPNGKYEGSYTYTVGKGNQIDLGAGVYSDSTIVINITAEIEHELRFEQTGQSKIEMNPPGGWDNWTSGGASQFRLEGSGAFKTTASAPFTVSLECQHTILNSCAMQMEGTDTLIQVATSITIPGIRERDSKTFITDWPIYVRSPSTPDYVLEPLWYVNAMDSTVKFSISEIESLRMGQFPGSTWRGSATLVFDAEIISP